MPTAIPAAAPTTTAADPMKTVFMEQTMLQLQNIQLPPGMIPVLLPPAVPGGTPTVIMMPAKGAMQSMAAVQSKQAAVASAVKAQSTSKTSQKEPSLYEAIEISKDDGDKGGGKESVKGSVKGSVKESAKESSKKSEKDSEGSKKSKKEVDLTKTGMAGPNNYYGYGTTSNVWSPQIGGFGNYPSMANSPVANQFLRDSLFDRENFQSRGCGWDQARGMCSDLLGICKGGCKDFRSRNQFSNLPDCLCVPLVRPSLGNASKTGINNEINNKEGNDVNVQVPMKRLKNHESDKALTANEHLQSLVSKQIEATSSIINQMKKGKGRSTNNSMSSALIDASISLPSTSFDSTIQNTPQTQFKNNNNSLNQKSQQKSKSTKNSFQKTVKLEVEDFSLPTEFTHGINFPVSTNTPLLSSNNDRAKVPKAKGASNRLEF
uniref:Uncharacterized protein n=1 Tax=Meloidogyne javanica TaxID=6303 RepID=A0A915LN94_MELJA